MARFKYIDGKWHALEEFMGSSLAYLIDEIEECTKNNSLSTHVVRSQPERQWETDYLSGCPSCFQYDCRWCCWIVNYTFNIGGTAGAAAAAAWLGRVHSTLVEIESFCPGLRHRHHNRRRLPLLDGRLDLIIA